MQQEEVTEIPLIYPLVSVTLKSVSIVDGRRILHECEEVIDFTDIALRSRFQILGVEFRDYVAKVVETAQSPQARDALQNILDTHRREPQRRSTDHPSLPASADDPVQGTLPLEPPVPSPDKASL